MELYVMYKDLFQPSFNVTQDFKGNLFVKNKK